MSATLVPLAQTAYFKRLVYLLPPPAALRGLQGGGHRARHRRVAAQDPDVVPLGTLLTELAPGILVPIGMEVVPRVSPEVLAQALGHGAGVLTVFTSDGPPFQLPRGCWRRSSGARWAASRPTASTSATSRWRRPAIPPWSTIRLGRFSLWGFPSPSRSCSASEPSARRMPRPSVATFLERFVLPLVAGGGGPRRAAADQR
ncbi:MAG: hypothetical protein HS111_31125 [Kofleriaceae bacterium]|nr:hypothetical protein [Kofleriaceae bacterium]